MLNMPTIQEFIDNVLVITVPILLSTFAFPLYAVLKISSRASNLWFATMFPYVTSYFGRHFKDIHSTLFANLDREVSGDAGRRQSRQLKICELGVGLGKNFQFYPNNALVTCVDINPSFVKHIEKIKTEHKNLVFEKVVIASAEDVKELADNEFDLVIATHLLCSTGDPDKVLKEVRRILRPDGKYYVLEHHGDRQSMTIRLLQRYLEPLWRVFAGNCGLSQDTLSRLEHNGFDVSSIKYLNIPHMPITLRPHIMGAATIKQR